MERMSHSRTIRAGVWLSLLLMVHALVPPVQAQTRDGRSVRPWEEFSPNSFRRDTEGPRPGFSPWSGEEREGMQTPSNVQKYLSEPTLASITYQIHIVGEVRNPGTYRITASDRLQEILQRAGGVSPQGSLRSIEIRRKGSGRKTYDLLRFKLYGELHHNPYLLDNDVVYVPLRKTVIQVVGSVNRPDIYELKEERMLADVIALAGGQSLGAAPNAPIRVIRFTSGEKQVIEIPNDPGALQGAFVESGDVIFVPNVLSAGRKFDYNIAKLPGDQVFYPSYEDRVFVLGGVFSPGPYPFNPYATVNQYLTLAGGTTKLGRVNRLTLITSMGEKRRIRKDDVQVINPGDTIFVPEPRIAPEGWLNIVTGLAGFGLSTTATVLSLTR